MKLVSLPALAAALCLGFLASPALAKGPIEASIDGPGLSDSITLGGGEYEDALAPGAPLMVLAEGTGFFEAAFGARVYESDPETGTPTTALSERPAGDLGPRYVITYLVPGPNNEEDDVTQHLYPFAKRGYVTYMAPGQPFFGGRETVGGWFLAPSEVEETLEAAGLPADSPTGTDSSPFPWTVVLVLGALAAALFFGWMVAARTRRPAPEGEASA